MKPAVCPFYEKDIPQVLEIEKIAYHTWIQQRPISLAKYQQFITN
jgi:hypothetical protein